MVVSDASAHVLVVQVRLKEHAQPGAYSCLYLRSISGVLQPYQADTRSACTIRTQYTIGRAMASQQRPISANFCVRESVFQ